MKHSLRFATFLSLAAAGFLGTSGCALPPHGGPSGKGDAAAPPASQAAPAAPAANTAQAPVPSAPPAPAASASPSSPASQGQGSAGAAANPGSAAALPPAQAPPVGLQPPDGKWLKDDQGREYFLDKWPKKEGDYRRLADGRVRIHFGISLDVAREDASFFYYKIYKVDPGAVGPNSNPKTPSAAELEQAAATYKVETPASHRLDFTDFGKGLPHSGQWRDGFDIADMNEDGHLDIVHGPARKGFSGPVIFLGDGQGNWRLWQEAHYPSFPYDYGDVAVADLNGDGHPDMVLAIHLKGFTALLGNGKGNFTHWDKGLDFQRPGRGGDGGGFSSRAVTTLKWNGDRLPDIVALGEGPRMAVANARGQGGAVSGSQAFGSAIYLNQGDGSWKRKDQGTGGAQVFGDAIAVGDFNGDGRPGFVTSSSAMGRGDLVHLPRADGGWDTVQLDIRPNAYVRAVAAGDFDHDGRCDVAVGYMSFELGVWRTGIDIFYSRPGGKWERRTLAAEEGRRGVTALGVGDLDGDHNLDLVALTGDGETWVFLGDGKGFFTRDASVIPANEGGCRGSHVQMADLDGDGKDEIVAAFAGEPSPMNAPGVCTSQGALRAWHAVAAQPAAPASRGAKTPP
ncbi:MAG TPA: VCBS repeat-containing protein [Thermoanaerobaculia bacterium]|nr:VCBS repeat-containing protein [Thermoanaerobaculia bacterium]